MFEAILTNVLNKYLTPYIDGLTPEQLKIGIFGGQLISTFPFPSSLEFYSQLIHVFLSHAC